jgi:hypothetical protein
MDQHEWVRACMARYKEQGLTPEPGGEWQEAHYPAPRGEGEDTVWLLHNDHQVQGILQSEEYGRMCFYPYDALKFLNSGPFVPGWFELYSLYKKWSKEHSKKRGAVTVSKLNSHPDKSEWNSRGGKVNAEKLNAHPNTVESRKTNARTLNTHPNREEWNSKGGIKGSTKVNAQKWKCLVTGHISSPGSLSIYQKARGIDTSLRVRVG